MPRPNIENPGGANDIPDDEFILWAVLKYIRDRVNRAKSEGEGIPPTTYTDAFIAEQKRRANSPDSQINNGKTN